MAAAVARPLTTKPLRALGLDFDRVGAAAVSNITRQVADEPSLSRRLARLVPWYQGAARGEQCRSPPFCLPWRAHERVLRVAGRLPDPARRGPGIELDEEVARKHEIQ